MPEPDWPRTYREAVDRTVLALPDSSIATLRELDRAALGRLHFGLGLWIRNTFGLWCNDALRRSCAEHAGGPHWPLGADEASSVIVDGVILRLRGEPDPAASEMCPEDPGAAGMNRLGKRFGVSDERMKEITEKALLRLRSRKP